MKKLVFALLSIDVLVGCDETPCSDSARRESHVETVWRQGDISMKRIEGHLYLVGDVDIVRSASGVRCIVHAESCPCKNTAKKED